VKHNPIMAVTGQLSNPTDNQNQDALGTPPWRINSRQSRSWFKNWFLL